MCKVSGMRNEPVALPALILGVVTAVLALLVGVGVIDEDLSAYIFGLIAAIIPLVAWYISRPRVTPNQNIPLPPPSV